MKKIYIKKSKRIKYSMRKRFDRFCLTRQHILVLESGGKQI
jgi:hypothetical protein